MRDDSYQITLPGDRNASLSQGNTADVRKARHAAILPTYPRAIIATAPPSALAAHPPPRRSLLPGEAVDLGPVVGFRARASPASRLLQRWHQVRPSTSR